MTAMNLELEIERLFAAHPSAIGRDLKTTLSRVLIGGALTPDVAAPALLALASGVKNGAIADLAERWMRELGYPDEQVREAVEAAALYAMINLYYSFRHDIELADYASAGLTMTGAARPLMGKHQFERLAMALSVLNKCTPCVRFHEAKLREFGSSPDEIRDLARLAAAVKGYASLP
jgi:alkyl hydroperoxide reductase subunit D